MNDSIETNAEALREIAKAVSNYKRSQLEIIDAYLKDVHYISESWRDEKYQELLRSVKALETKIETLSGDLDPFIRFLNNKADQIDMYNKGVTIDE